MRSTTTDTGHDKKRKKYKTHTIIFFSSIQKRYSPYSLLILNVDYKNNLSNSLFSSYTQWAHLFHQIIGTRTKKNSKTKQVVMAVGTKDKKVAVRIKKHEEKNTFCFVFCSASVWFRCQFNSNFDLNSRGKLL